MKCRIIRGFDIQKSEQLGVFRFMWLNIEATTTIRYDIFWLVSHFLEELQILMPALKYCLCSSIARCHRALDLGWLGRSQICSNTMDGCWHIMNGRKSDWIWPFMFDITQVVLPIALKSRRLAASNHHLNTNCPYILYRKTLGFRYLGSRLERPRDRPLINR